MSRSVIYLTKNHTSGQLTTTRCQTRPPPPRATKRVKTWQDLEAMQAQTFSLKPQKDSNVKKISVEQSSMDNFVGCVEGWAGVGDRGHRDGGG